MTRSVYSLVPSHSRVFVFAQTYDAACTSTPYPGFVVSLARLLSELTEIPAQGRTMELVCAHLHNQSDWIANEKKVQKFSYQYNLRACSSSTCSSKGFFFFFLFFLINLLPPTMVSILAIQLFPDQENYLVKGPFEQLDLHIKY